MEKKLYRSQSDKMLFGICGGLATYFNVDATVIRLIMLLVWFTAAGFLFYLAAGLIIPVEP